ncbi:hypothetical protein AALA22_15135 [Anaerovoracaceae bacterium 41-7]
MNYDFLEEIKKIALECIIEEHNLNHSYERRLTPINVIFNEPATIVFWDDGTKTIVKCQDGDKFDKEKGLAIAYVKRLFNNSGNFNEVFRKWVDEK